MNTIKIVTKESMQLYTKKLKEYIDVRIAIEVHGKTNCPNCGAIINNNTKCEYCGTSFVRWMSGLTD